ncbi:glycoprotein [Macaca mulatta rhadinovirus 17577]|uniref:Packaging protein UL32 n=3 Tax=Macacine gammaherpesvirus 5 TaxID=154334 RepID=Q77NH8_9GAMA|nr:glycoprotein [Macacine gammaherpesvirus 5]AAD21402.1 glycoprotein [Macaca mulatta rhadinovirus 17577]AAF60055.1 glycoprotein [Rhesus monkey rhadinovirus H26-95]ADB08330.1 ORF68 [Macaca mulatta rhadinovirus]WUF06368.1 glycoprotein [synthetic construct]ADB08331.1 ORF68 [Macaca mulatta rhadinovirus]
MFVPWQLETLMRHWPSLRGLVEQSFLPGTPDGAFNSPVLIHTQDSLQPASSCRVCSLLFTLVRTFPPPDSFFEDYGWLCLTCLYAPRSWTATLMVAADLLELTHVYFPQCVKDGPVYTAQSILGIDVQLHFFATRCFRPIDREQILHTSHLNFLQTEFIRGMLEGTIPGSFCFKTSWPRTEKDDQQPTVACCSVGRGSHTNRDNRLPEDLEEAFNSTNAEEKPSLLGVFSATWAESQLLGSDTQQADTHLQPSAFPTPEDADQSQGPCLMHPTLNLKTKNHTASICVLCECLAAHPDAGPVLKDLRRDILENMENNVKLVNRISYILNDPDSLSHVRDEHLRGLIKRCSAQEIHKHFFCDPVCVLNTYSHCPAVLFKCPPPEKYKKLKARLATGEFLDCNRIFDCETLQTLAVLFKGSQLAKIGKTTSLEIIRELGFQLRRHNIQITHPFQTSNLYI